MNNIDYDAYLTDVFRLTRTMVIKIETIAERDNRVQMAAGLEVGLDKRTWRYYMNLNGDYHPTDEIMTIVSIDTGDEIVFNKDNLKTHLATYREYSAGGYWFKRLVERYPGQADLVRGILAPIPYEETIEAQDYKILKYNQALVLWNEDQLIPQLQEWIYSEVEQVFRHEYRYTDNLMLPLAVMLLYADLIKAIVTIRFEAIGTRHAHDFYIWSHIDSYGDFSKYKNSLTRFQTMWLYRNIAWLRQNPGQQYTLNKLMDNLLTHSNVPLAKYDMVENTENQLEELTPSPRYRKLQMNLLEDYGRDASFIDTLQMVNKQKGMAKENPDQIDIYYDDALMKGQFSLHSELPTKVLESKMTDFTNRHIDTKMSVVYNEWIYLASKGYFQGRILVTDPKTGKQIRLPVGDAYYMWRYLVDFSRGQKKDYLEPAYYQNVMRAVAPSLEELIDIGGPYFIKPILAYDIRALWIPPQIFISPEYLMSYSDEVYAVMWKHRKIYSQFYDLNKRARVKNTTELMYTSGVATNLTDLTTFKELHERYEVDFTEYSPEEARNFAWEIFKRITGWDSNSNPSLRIKQAALIDIMMQLSSYTIQVIKEIDDGMDTIEMPNETFIGDPQVVGKGNTSDGEFHNVMMDVPSHMEPVHTLDGSTDLIFDETPTLHSTIDGYSQIPSNDVFKLVDDDDPRKTAMRIPDDSYFRLRPEPIAPVPPTNYVRLVFPAEEYIPPTFYERLEYPFIGWDIPKTDYERLEYPFIGWDIAVAHYGRLEFPEITFELAAAFYGRLEYKEGE